MRKFNWDFISTSDPDSGISGGKDAASALIDQGILTEEGNNDDPSSAIPSPSAAALSSPSFSGPASISVKRGLRPFLRWEAAQAEAPRRGKSTPGLGGQEGRGVLVPHRLWTHQCSPCEFLILDLSVPDEKGQKALTRALTEKFPHV